MNHHALADVPSLRPVLDRLAAEDEAAVATAPAAPAPAADAAVDPVSAIEAQMDRMLAQTSQFTRGKLTELRGRIDDAMIALEDRERQLHEAVSVYGDDCRAAIQSGKIMSEAMDDMVNRIKGSAATLVPFRRG